MTLTEYQNQRQIERLASGTVLLQHGEYKEGATITISGGTETLTQIFMSQFGYAEYVVKNGSGTLYTTDDHGNPKHRSVFYIESLKYGQEYEDNQREADDIVNFFEL